MLGIDLKRSVVTLAVTAGLLAVAGPASAQGGDRVGTTGLKLETEVTDYVRLSAASNGNRPRTSLSKSGSWRFRRESGARDLRRVESEVV